MLNVAKDKFNQTSRQILKVQIQTSQDYLMIIHSVQEENQVSTILPVNIQKCIKNKKALLISSQTFIQVQSV